MKSKLVDYLFDQPFPFEKNLGEKLSGEEIEGLLDEADGDGEGFINYSEFCSIKNLI